VAWSVAVDIFDYDAELRRYHERLWQVVGVGPDDRVLDIGCGAGLTTRQAARAAVRGSALGVDVSDRMLAHARRRCAAEGLRNIDYVLADAQVHPFPPDGFTLGISRFGTMFFTDPLAAFTNIGRALRPGARLVQLVWQDGKHQEWATAIQAALTGNPAAPTPALTGGPFSLADPTVLKDILTTAGFTEIDFTDVREPIYYGPDVTAAHAAVLDLRMTQDLLANLDATDTEQALDRLRETLTAHDTGTGVYFDSRAWIITAHRAVVFRSYG
jgi:ubiquinone/menaquinone biosynthesis C-methylase UbiE